MIVQSVLYAWKLLQRDVYHMVYMAFPYLKCSLTQAGRIGNELIFEQRKYG